MSTLSDRFIFTRYLLTLKYLINDGIAFSLDIIKSILFILSSILYIGITFINPFNYYINALSYALIHDIVF